MTLLKLVNIFKMAKIKYDKETKILSIRLSDKRSVDSDAKNNIVIDYDKEGDIVNIEIMKISLEEFSKVKEAVSE